MEDALVTNPHIAKLIVDLFEARLDPSRQNSDETEKLTGEIEEALEAVVSLDEDRILRSFLDITLATLRTNYYQSTPEGDAKPHLSFKLDPQRFPASRCRCPGSRSSSTPRAPRACICGAGRSPAAASAGRTGARTSGPRSSAS